MLFASGSIYAQDFSGQILDSTTKEAIPYAQLFLVDYHQGVKTDDNGFFSFSGTYPTRVTIRVSAFGYETIVVETSTSNNMKFYLNETHLIINEVTVSSAKNDLQKFAVTHIEMRSIEELNVIPVTNLGQAIEQIPGVYNLSTGTGVSKPVIRGLQGTRVVSVLNGVRIENQQWGGDHGIGITDLGIGNVEVIKGPASLLYGADALGGVIYYSDEGYASQQSSELKLSSQFESNTLGTTNSAFYKGATKSLRINVGGRYTSHAAFQVPNGKYAANSGFEDLAGKIGIGWSKGKWISNVRYNLSSSKIGIIGETEDSIVTSDSFLSDSRERAIELPYQNFTNHVASFDNKIVWNKHTLQLLAGYTRSNLQEFEDTAAFPSMNIKSNNALYTFKMISTLSNSWELIYGIQGMYQWQNNGDDTEERLVPNASQLDNGAFVNLQLKLNKWRLQGGMRLDNRQTKSEADTIAFPNALNKSFTGYSFALGSVYNIKNHTLRLNLSSGYRVPHFSELLSDGEHHGTFRYEKGDENLIPEQAVQLDVTYEYEADHISFVVNPFISNIKNYIYLDPTDSVIEGLPVFQYGQLSQANLAGIDLGFHYHPHFAHFLHIESSYSFIRGVAGTDNLSLMPQSRINTSLIGRFDMKSKVKISEIVVQHTYYFPQSFVSNFETRSSDYSLFNVGANLKWDSKVPMLLQFGVRNIFNTNYINHLSRLKNIGLSSPGRNIYVKLELEINYKKKR